MGPSSAAGGTCKTEGGVDKCVLKLDGKIYASEKGHRILTDERGYFAGTW